jgi:hypothetical protein
MKLMENMTLEIKCIVVHLRHARTVTSKHVPAITQQWMKRCFLPAKLSSAVLCQVAPCPAPPRVASVCSTVMQQ